MGPKEYKGMMDYLTGPRMAKGGRAGYRNPNAVVTKNMQEKSAMAKKLKATKKLKDFVEKFKLENNGRLPSQQEIIKGTGSKTSVIQKYLEEGVDFKKRLTKQQAGTIAGIKSGEVRAVPEGQDPSYVKRAKTLDEANKFLSKQDKADFKQINAGKKAINKYFKNNSGLINTTEFGKKIKALLALRLDKDTGNIFSKLRSDEYYEDLAKKGKLFDIFDIKPVKEGGKSLRFPTNINITPGQFNQVFIQSQAGKFFAKGVNEDSLKSLNNLLTDYNIKVKLPNVGYVGADNPVAVDRTKGTFPKVTDTLKKMDAPEEILNLFKSRGLNIPEKEISNFSKAVKEIQNKTSSMPVNDFIKLGTAQSKDIANFIKKYGINTGKVLMKGLAFATPVFAGMEIADQSKAYEQGESVGQILANVTGNWLMPGAGEMYDTFEEQKMMKNIASPKELAAMKKEKDFRSAQMLQQDPLKETDYSMDIEKFRPTKNESEALFNLIEKTAAADFYKKQNLAAERAARPLPGIDPFQAANGGIAGLSGGIDKGPQRRSMNPDSQGLSGILKRGIKT